MNPVPRAPASLLTHISSGVYNTSIQISKNIFKLISQKCTCDFHSLTTNLLFLQSPVCCQMETLSVQWLRPNTLKLDPSFSHSPHPPSASAVASPFSIYHDLFTSHLHHHCQPMCSHHQLPSDPVQEPSLPLLVSCVLFSSHLTICCPSSTQQRPSKT